MNLTQQDDNLNIYDAFSRSQGSGSASAEDDFTEKNSIYSNEWGSTAATSFDASDEDANGNSLSDERTRRFKELYALNNGKGEQSRKGQIRSSHIRNDAKTFMSVLEIPSPQRKRIMHILQELDISSNSFGGRRYEKIILAICSLVCDEELTRRMKREHDNISDIKSNIDIQKWRLYGQDEYKELMETVNMTGTEHRKIRAQVRERSKYFSQS
jgi:hypothetical protein